MSKDISWTTEPGPYQYNIKYAGQTTKFSGSDTEELFIKNNKSKSTYDLLKKFGWDQPDVISYTYNQHGFRCEEFDSRPCGIALGCSFTEGTALPIDQTWPSILTKMSGIHVWNLGAGGASIDTTFRILDFYLPRLKPRFVCLLQPPNSRYEYCDINTGYPIISPSDLGKHKEFSMEWLTQSRNGEYNMRKTLLAMEHLCQNYVVPLIVEDSQFNLDQSSSAIYNVGRDLMHPGTIYQQDVAKKMWNRIKIYDYLFTN